MLGTQLAVLRDGAPTGLTDALDLVAGLDGALVRGFARVGEDDAAALAALAGALAPTPLGDRVADAAGTVTAGSVAEEHLVALAGARSALLGAAHDALLGQLDSALGRARAPWASGPTEPSAAAPPPLAVVRAWLHELAVTGWRGVDHEIVAAAAAPVEAALAEPGLRRLAVLLDGFAAELRACAPVATMAHPPARRWADLWARGMLLAQDAAAVAAPPAVEEVSGRLLVLGVDVHEHDTAVQAQVHGILEPADGAAPRLVRVAVGAVKVDTIVGPALWRLLDAHPVLLTALAERRGLTVTGLPLCGGDLLWHDDRARLAEAADPFATARVLLPTAVAAASAPLDRHPAGIAEPVLLEGYAVRDDEGALTVELDGHPLAVAVDRLPSCAPVTPELVAASSACLGLLRWDDGRWLLQPLAVQATVKRKPVVAHTGDWARGITDPKVAKADAKAGDAVAVLRERAGRLLRR
ncbi:hypothetical protein GA0070606_0920 [Micromonospora citrea]|uniref:Uncharacterized protein n=1 Tax=Micromonospora citrea TaxID=47855 RepID=A0A1C6TWE7_9ACTN|nr:hypothetical protein [Micromonospora citrea]SCL46094.1 hypothetical protein GA0070606_0920 [Micromonospora citrea]